MSLILKLQNVYFDAVQLCEGLQHTPHDCSIWISVEEKPNEFNCCTFTQRNQEPYKKSWCQRNLDYLYFMRNDIEVLQADLHHEISRLRPEEIAQGLDSYLFVLQQVASVLRTISNQMESCLLALQKNCLPEPLQDLKASVSQLKECIYELEKIFYTEPEPKARVVAFI